MNSAATTTEWNLFEHLTQKRLAFGLHVLKRPKKGNMHIHISLRGQRRTHRDVITSIQTGIGDMKISSWPWMFRMEDHRERELTDQEVEQTANIYAM